MNYIENIKRVRDNKRVSQTDMAEKLGIAQNNYGRIERGLTELTVDRLYKIAEILNVGVEDILGLTNVDSQNNTQGSDIEKLKIENEELKKRVSILQENNDLLRSNLLNYKAIISLMKKDRKKLSLSLQTILFYIFGTIKDNIDELIKAQIEYSKNGISAEEKEDIEYKCEKISEDILDEFKKFENEESIKEYKDEVIELLKRLIYFNDFLLPEYTLKQIEVLRNEFEKYLSSKKTPDNKNKNI